jgi:hypothetical protein
MATQMGMIVTQGTTKPISRAQIAWVNCPVVKGVLGSMVRSSALATAHHAVTGLALLLGLQSGLLHALFVTVELSEHGQHEPGKAETKRKDQAQGDPGAFIEFVPEDLGALDHGSS